MIVVLMGVSGAGKTTIGRELAARLAARAHRDMPASLLESQFAILEPPQEAIVVDVAADAASCVETIVRAVAA